MGGNPLLRLPRGDSFQRHGPDTRGTGLPDPITEAFGLGREGVDIADRLASPAGDIIAAGLMKRLVGQILECTPHQLPPLRGRTTTLSSRAARWATNSENSDGGPVCCSKLFGSHHLRKRSASPLSPWMLMLLFARSF